MAILYYRDLSKGTFVPLIVPRDPLDEVEISPTQPTDPEVKVWIDTSAIRSVGYEETIAALMARIESLEHLIIQMRGTEGTT